MNTSKTIGMTILGVLVTIMVVVAGWYAYWHLAKASQTNRYKVNTGSQQYQAGLVSQERDRVAAFDSLGTAIATATDASVKLADQNQQDQIKTTFCQVYLNLNPAPTDLSQASARICQ